MARGFRGRVAAGAALAACALAPATAAAAENGLIYISASTPITSGQPAAVDAVCPGGTHLVGTGADALTGFVAFQGVLNSVQPIDLDDQNLKPDDGARIFTFNTTASPGTSQAWAVCARGKTLYRSHTTKLRVNHAATAKARCPQGTNVVGGGNYITGANDDATLQATRPFDAGDTDHKPDDGWRVKAFNLRDFKKDVTAYAICRKERPKYLGGFGGSSPPGGGGGGAVCNDKGLSVSGPGAEVKGEASLVRLTAYVPADIDDPFEAGDQPDDYVVHDVELSTTGQVEDGSFAACLNLAE